MTSNVEIVNFGCRLNSYESNVMSEQLKDSKEKIIVFNTCAVTKEAERQAKQSIRKYKKMKPDHKIVVTGCAAQVNHVQFSSMQEVDLVLGNIEKMDPNNFFSEEKVIVNDIMSVKETASHMIQSFEGKARSFIQVQNGCNHRCTFCIIPYGRGNSRSVPIGEIVNQVKILVDNGFKEIVLTGVDITDYGKDLPGSPSFGQMVNRLLNLVPDLPRLRLSSIDVAEIDEDLIEVIANNHRLMPHFHISLQSGDNMILKRMKRRHNRDDVFKFCEQALKLRPDSVFGADIITGFPTETDEMFENTLDLIDRAEISLLHVFPYSEREGTPAARMPQVEKHIRKERAEILRNLGSKVLDRVLQKNIGRKSVSVLVEQDNIGKTENFLPVFLSKNYISGTMLTVDIIDVQNQQLISND